MKEGKNFINKNKYNDKANGPQGNERLRKRSAES